MRGTVRKHHTPRVNKDRIYPLRVTDVSEHPLSGTVDIEFVEVVPVEDEPPARHASEEMYGIALGAGLDADLLLMTGSEPRNIVEADLYRRLAGDLLVGPTQRFDLSWLSTSVHLSS